jgi:uncharacterized membrane protein
MLENFWAEFFAKPILEYSGYNLVNTLVYGLILLAVSRIKKYSSIYCFNG